MFPRRALLLSTAFLAALIAVPFTLFRRGREVGNVWVNDIHSKLNRTRVLSEQVMTSVSGVQELVREAKAHGQKISWIFSTT
jgi:hypothetical protein